MTTLMINSPNPDVSSHIAVWQFGVSLSWWLMSIISNSHVIHVSHVIAYLSNNPDDLFFFMRV